MREKEKMPENGTKTGNGEKSNEKSRRQRSRGFILYAFPVIIAILIGYIFSRQIFNFLKTFDKLNEKPDFLQDRGKIKNIEIDFSNLYEIEFTNQELSFQNEILEIEGIVESNNFKSAATRLKSLARLIPNSPRCVFMSARLIDRLAEAEQNILKVKKSINIYKKLMILPDADNRLIYAGGLRLVNRLHFLGKINEANKYGEFLVKKFPSDLRLKNDLGISYLMSNKFKLAKEQFLIVLKIDNKNSIAQCNLAYLLKTIENKLTESIDLFKQCLQSEEKLVRDSRFFYHLGDALQRLNRTQEAYEFYEIAAKLELFLSAYQRSLFNIPGLQAKPWWTTEETVYSPYLKILVDNWEAIRDEAIEQLNSPNNNFLLDEENLREKGDLKKLNLYIRGEKENENCKKSPLTCSLIEKIDPMWNSFRGDVAFAVMSSETHLWPHCGPTNCRLRAHLGLIVPDGTRIRVANETRTLSKGNFLIFDDSFENEVWKEGKENCLLLRIDLWHPDLTNEQRNNIFPRSIKSD